VIGRRIASLPVMLVLTFRGGEVATGHPLHATLGAVAAHPSRHIQHCPLSREPVPSLAGDHTEKVYAATDGNPFCVSGLSTPISGNSSASIKAESPIRIFAQLGAPPPSAAL